MTSALLNRTNIINKYIHYYLDIKVLLYANIILVLP